MKLFNSTERWSKWWKNRKIDWKEHYLNPDHPHRTLIAEVLKHMRWGCLIEIGCGAGANLMAILKSMPNPQVQVGGVDINKDAIELANKNFKGGLFKVGTGEDVMLSDDATDIVLTDMYMIYLTPKRIAKQLKEIARITRNSVVFCELHSENRLERLAIKWREGYNVYDYKKLLDKHGFYDIKLYKLPPEFWPESKLQQKYCYIITAKVPY